MYKLGLLTVLVASAYGAEKVITINHGLVGGAYAPYGVAPYAAAPYAASPYAAYAPYAAAAPLAAPAYAAAAPVAAYAPYVAAPYVGSQYHAQDEFGNLNYGYSNLQVAKHEVGNAYTGVNGGYSYVDANNVLQTIEYVADGAGFRVSDSRLPVAPTFNPEPLVAPTFNPEPLVAPVFNPEPLVAPVDTPEVAEAKAAHLALVAAANAGDRKRRDADAEPAILDGYTRVISAPTPLIHNAPALHAAPLYGRGLGYGYAGLGYGAGLGYAGLGYAGLGYGHGYGLGYAGLY
jgi:hypothetical protein